MAEVSTFTALQKLLTGLQVDPGLTPAGSTTPAGAANETGPTGPASALTGIGVPGQAGPVPDAASAAATGADAGLQAMLQSLMAFMPKMGSDDTEANLAALLSKTRDLLNASNDEEIKTEMSLKASHVEERKQELAKARDKQAQAEHHHKKKSIWDKVKLSFEIIGAVTAVVVGAALIATGVGAAAGAMLIGVGAVSLMMIANEQMQEHSRDGLGMAGELAKDLGADPKACGKADFGFQIAMAAIALIMSAAMFVIPGGQAAAVAEAADAGTTLAGAADAATAASEAGDTASTVADASETASTVSDTSGTGSTIAEDDVANLSDFDDAGSLAEGTTTADSSANAGATTTQAAADAGTASDTVAADAAANSADGGLGRTAGLTAVSGRTGANLLNAGAILGSTAGDVGSAVEAYQEGTDQADAKTFQARAKQSQAAIDMLNNVIDMVLAQLQSQNVAFSAMMASLVDAANDEGKTATHMKFVG